MPPVCRDGRGIGICCTRRAIYTGYAVKTMPGVREAIEQKNYAEAEAEIVRVARALEREKVLIEAAAADLERVK